jgi:magnesium-transporting ATPase (P-type)
MERYLSVLHPCFHRTRLKKKGIVIFVVGAALALLSLVAASIFVEGEIIKYISILILATFLIFVVFAYTRIYLVIRKITRVHTDAEAGEENRKHLSRERKHALACFIVVAIFVLLLIPFMLHPIFEKFGRMTSNAYIWWSVSLLLSISSMNSTIFFWQNTVLRNEAKKVAKNMFMFI